MINNGIEDSETQNLAYVRRAWCVRLAVGLVLLGAVLNIIYLWWHCPMDLGEDEAHYWEWSRHLDYGYYSKGPGIAWIIAAATAVGRWLGFAQATMPIVRMPAVLFATISGLTSLSLARRIFRDDRAALAVTVLSAGVPVFAIGSLLITIDSPMYCCWAIAVCALWRAVEDSKKSTEPSGSAAGFLYLAGFFTGLGMLIKPVVIAVPLCAVVAAWMSPAIRRKLATWHSAGAVLLALLMQLPIIFWNAQHGWLMFRHIATQGGLSGTHSSSIPFLLRPITRLGLYVGSQLGLFAPGILFVLLAIAVVWALRKWKKSGCHAFPISSGFAEEACVEDVGLAFLLAFTIPLWLFYAALSLWTNVEPNWPVASYFTGMILLGGFVAKFWTAPNSKALRGWAAGAVLGGIVLTVLGQHTEWFYPWIARGTFAEYGNKLRRDPAFRLHGFVARASALDTVMNQMKQQTGRDPMVITSDYQLSSSLAFYLSGQPFTYCIMSRVGGRMSQYDVWPGLDERNAAGELVHRGQDAVVVGSIDADHFASVVMPAFKRVDQPVHVPVYDEHGLQIRDLVVWQCHDFQGLPPESSGKPTPY